MPYREHIIGVKTVTGRYIHAMMLPNQLTCDRVNPNSSTTVTATHCQRDGSD